MDFLKKIATDAPVPAGGAAAAYTSSLAIALLYKVILFELNRDVLDPDISKNIQVARREIHRLLGDMEKVVTKDAEAFLKFTESRQDRQQNEIKKRFSELMDLTMTVLEKSYSGLEWANQLSALVPKGMQPHLKVACELLMGAIKATVHVADANLHFIKNAKKRQNLLEKLDTIRKDAVKKYEVVITAFD